MSIAVPQRDSFVPAYRPLMELGRGGMARVYLAESLASGLQHKLVVLKVLNQELASDPEMHAGFMREAEISARVNHPNIVSVHEVFEHRNTPVMVMQYLDGLALSEVLSRMQGRFPLKLHLHILCQTLGALHYFHELKGSNGELLECVHRDVSPHNVMVLHEGGIKVVDFGVAKVRAEAENHTRTGVIKGKVAYMPPEQLLSCANVDRRADIYSVGVMLWEAVAGRRMWRGMDPSSRMRAIVRGEIPDIREAAPGVSDALARVIERALAHTPDGRYATAEEMQIDLEQITHTEGGYSLPRELSEFMRLNFGEDRRERQRKIEKTIEDKDFTVADATWTTMQPSVVTAGGSPVEAARSMAIAPSKSWRKVLVGAAVAVVTCFGAIALTRHDAAPVATASAPVAGTPVQLRVQSDPAGAEVYLDGVKLGVTPLLQTRKASAQDATLELRAPGRMARSEVIRLVDDVALDLTLPAAQDTPTDVELSVGAARVLEEPAVQEERRPSAARPRRPLTRESAHAKAADETQPVSAPGATPKASAEAADDCDPPYRLDPGGVKVFKPQCF